MLLNFKAINCIFYDFVHQTKRKDTFMSTKKLPENHIVLYNTKRVRISHYNDKSLEPSTYMGRCQSKDGAIFNHT